MRLYHAVPEYYDSGIPSWWAHYRATIRYSIPRLLFGVGANIQNIKFSRGLYRICERRSLAPLEYQYRLGTQVCSSSVCQDFRPLHRDANLFNAMCKLLKLEKVYSTTA